MNCSLVVIFFFIVLIDMVEHLNAMYIIMLANTMANPCEVLKMGFSTMANGVMGIVSWGMV